MEEYYFLFVIGLVWTLFASVQDLRTREVSNWLNFSLIAIGLSYRAFYSLAVSDATFFFHGLVGFAVFFVLAYVLYYARAFAGGDAKLLMGYGALLPVSEFLDIVPSALLFLFVLFFIGSVYSLLFSIRIVSRNRVAFMRDFSKRLFRSRFVVGASLVLFMLFVILGLYDPLAFFISILFLIPLLWVYAKSLDRCMIHRVPPSKLTEGDWILSDISLARGVRIKKTVHGLSARDIALLRKYKKSIKVKDGIPFVPVFLLTLLFVVYLYLFTGETLLSLFDSFLLNFSL